MGEFLVVDQWNFMTASLDGDGLHAVGDVEQSYRARLWYRPGDHAHVMRFSHDYRAYEIETSPDEALQTNGHLHRLAWTYRFASPDWELSLSPVVAGSSNAGRHPQSDRRRVHLLAGLRAAAARMDPLGRRVLGRLSR